VGMILLKVGGSGASGAEDRVETSTIELGGEVPNALWAITRYVYFRPGNRSEASYLLTTSTSTSSMEIGIWYTSFE